MHHVRGGIHVLPVLDRSGLLILQRHYRANHELCTKCGGADHYAAQCTRDGQPSGDDDALAAFQALRGQLRDADDRGDAFDRAKSIAMRFARR